MDIGVGAIVSNGLCRLRRSGNGYWGRSDRKSISALNCLSGSSAEIGGEGSGRSQFTGSLVQVSQSLFAFST
jgi:hypothetical protein